MESILLKKATREKVKFFFRWNVDKRIWKSENTRSIRPRTWWQIQFLIRYLLLDSIPSKFMLVVADHIDYRGYRGASSKFIQIIEEELRKHPKRMPPKFAAKHWQGQLQENDRWGLEKS
jgi:hypothetical protein